MLHAKREPLRRYRWNNTATFKARRRAVLRLRSGVVLPGCPRAVSEAPAVVLCLYHTFAEYGNG